MATQEAHSGTFISWGGNHLYKQGAIMKLLVSSIFPALGILCIAAAVTPGSIRAQAPAGPLPAAQPQASPASAASPQNLQPRPETRTSILGQWKLNLDESDDPRKKMQDASTSRGSGSRGSGVSIAGFPIGGHGGSGGSRGGESDEERLRTQNAISPANSLTLAQKDPKNPEIDLTEDQNLKQALFTDGRKIQKPDSKDETPQEIAAHWDGSQLVTDEKSPHGGKMSRTFELSSDGTQLFETIRLTMGRSNTPLNIRYVYDAVPAAGPSTNQ
jgi:hypothetical protein